MKPVGTYLTIQCASGEWTGRVVGHGVMQGYASNMNPVYLVAPNTRDGYAEGFVEINGASCSISALIVHPDNVVDPE